MRDLVQNPREGRGGETAPSSRLMRSSGVDAICTVRMYDRTRAPVRKPEVEIQFLVPPRPSMVIVVKRWKRLVASHVGCVSARAFRARLSSCGKSMMRSVSSAASVGDLMMEVGFNGLGRK